MDIVDDLAFTMGIYTEIDSLTKILNKIHLLDPSWRWSKKFTRMFSSSIKKKKRFYSST